MLRHWPKRYDFLSKVWGVRSNLLTVWRNTWALCYSIWVNNRSDEKLLNNRSDGSFYLFVIGVGELGALKTSESSGTIIDSSAILLKKFLLKKLRPSISQESPLKKVRGYSEISRSVKKYRDPGGEEAVSWATVQAYCATVYFRWGNYDNYAPLAVAFGGLMFLGKGNTMIKGNYCL